MMVVSSVVELARWWEQERKEASRMVIELHYITDQLTYYGLKKQAGHAAFRLANLFFWYT